MSLLMSLTPALPLQRLSDSATFLTEIERLYRLYGHEIAEFRPIMREWCHTTKSCKFCDYEVELMYMLLREYKPEKVFEMAPNVGYSSHWIMHALSLNDNRAELHSFDIHKHSVKHMNTKDFPRAEWKFTLGDYAALYDAGKLDMFQYDFVFIDALHEEEFARGYCRRLLEPLLSANKRILVAIHDIAASKTGGGRESSEVYKFLAYSMSKGVSNLMTMSRYNMPNNLYAVDNAKDSVSSTTAGLHKPDPSILITAINTMRAEMKIIRDCGDECHEALFDPLYFENNASPAIFFQLN